MKLPRWLLMILLITSVLAGVGAGAWWWVKWPERTMRTYCEAGERSRIDDMKNMSSATMQKFLDQWSEGETLQVGKVCPVPRATIDALLGRQEFEHDGAHAVY